MPAEIEKLEKEMMQLSERLHALRKKTVAKEIRNYELSTLTGKVKLSELFAGKKTLFAIHNMGQGCRYCTLWADGFHGFLQHLEDRFSVILLSKDSPEVQQQFASSRQWRFRMVSHAGSEYAKEQGMGEGTADRPGLVCYEKRDGKIYRMNAAGFGPGDVFCSLWHVVSLAGESESEFTPQYNYWQRPAKLDDGGENLR